MEHMHKRRSPHRTQLIRHPAAQPIMTVNEIIYSTKFRRSRKNTINKSAEKRIKFYRVNVASQFNGDVNYAHPITQANVNLTSTTQSSRKNINPDSLTAKLSRNFTNIHIHPTGLIRP